jgi:hypothetical protein
MKTKIESLKEKLINKTVTKTEIDYIINILNKSERERIVESNRIKGAIKQFLNNHPILTKELIGSLTKRIQGALLSNKPVKKETNNSFGLVMICFIIGVIAGLLKNIIFN